MRIRDIKLTQKPSSSLAAWAAVPCHVRVPHPPWLRDLKITFSTRFNCSFQLTFCDWCATSRLNISQFKTFFASSSDDSSLSCRRRSLSEEVTWGFLRTALIFAASEGYIVFILRISFVELRKKVSLWQKIVQQTTYIQYGNDLMASSHCPSFAPIQVYRSCYASKLQRSSGTQGGTDVVTNMDLALPIVC